MSFASSYSNIHRPESSNSITRNEKIKKRSMRHQSENEIDRSAKKNSSFCLPFLNTRSWYEMYTHTQRASYIQYNKFLTECSQPHAIDLVSINFYFSSPIPAYGSNGSAKKKNWKRRWGGKKISFHCWTMLECLLDFVHRDLI